MKVLYVCEQKKTNYLPDLKIEYKIDSWKNLAVLKAIFAKNTSPININKQLATPKRE